MKGKILAIVIGVLILKFFFFYRGIYLPPKVETYKFDEITIPKISPKEFHDEFLVGKGIVAFDFSHNNSFAKWELNSLLSRLVSRGFGYKFVESDIPEALRYASAFVVISPKAFSPEEIEEIRSFLQKGGRLMLVSDPTRFDEINTLSAEFGIIFEEGYLYNMYENDGNFRNIFLKNFVKSDLTNGLRKISFYSACPITSSGEIILTDENTFATRKKAHLFSPVVLKEGVLAICDLTFMIDPYNNLLDNPKFLSNIADFLTRGNRTFWLVDFPYPIQDSNIVILDPGLFKFGMKMKNLLKDSTLGKKDISRNTVFIGLYPDYVGVSKYLDKENISIGEKIRISDIEIEKVHTSIISFHKEDGRNILVVLSNSEDDLDNALDFLENGKFRDFLINDNLAVITLEE